MEMKKFAVPVTLFVFGENEEDALDYVHQALDHSDLLDQDGIYGIDDSIELEDIEELEE